MREARTERFDFLGYAFGPHWFKKTGKWYLGASPSKKGSQRLETRVSEMLVPGNVAPWENVRDELNSMLLGWSGYLSYGTTASAYKHVDCDPSRTPAQIGCARRGSHVQSESAMREIRTLRSMSGKRKRSHGVD